MLAAAAVVAPLLATARSADAIIGGTPVERPPGWMAALHLDGEFLCGGSLIAPAKVLTATHCIAGIEAGRLSVAHGRRNVDTVEAEELTPVRRIRTGPGDVSVLALEKRVRARAIRIVGPKQASAWAPGTRSRVLGYGARWVLGNGGVPLHAVRVPIRSDAVCSRGLAGYDSALEICAGDDLGGRDACSGDSGGPLLVPGRRGGEMIAGVVSGGFACALPGQYGLYARLGGPAIRGWLTRVLARR